MHHRTTGSSPEERLSLAGRRLAWIITGVVGAVMSALILMGSYEPQPGGQNRASLQVQAALAASPPAASAQSHFSAAATRKRLELFAQVHGDEAYERLAEPRHGEWLWNVQESGQSFAEYVRSNPNRKSRARGALHIQPFDDLNPQQAAVVEAMREHTAVFFDTRTDLLPPRRVSQPWYNQSRRQYDGDRIVADLAGRVPGNSLGVFGIMAGDLYGLDLNYVFGMALIDKRAGVHSLHRYGASEALLRRRAIKVAAHEIGHMFGLEHCVFYKCVMNGSNSIEELDSEPAHLCPVCMQKLAWNLGFNVADRYARLEQLYRKFNLPEEVAFVHARVDELARSARAPAAPAPVASEHAAR
jgi:archaemetzincin